MCIVDGAHCALQLVGVANPQQEAHHEGDGGEGDEEMAE